MAVPANWYTTSSRVGVTLRFTGKLFLLHHFPRLVSLCPGFVSMVTLCLNWKDSTDEGQEDFHISPVLNEYWESCAVGTVRDGSVWLSAFISSIGSGKITLRSDSEKISLVVYGKFSKRKSQKDCLVQGSFPAVPSHWLNSASSTSLFWELAKQIIHTPNVGFVIFLQMVKNSTTVGRGMTTGSDSFPLVSYSDTYPSRRNHSRSSAELW